MAPLDLISVCSFFCFFLFITGSIVCRYLLSVITSHLDTAQICTNGESVLWCTLTFKSHICFEAAFPICGQWDKHSLSQRVTINWRLCSQSQQLTGKNILYYVKFYIKKSFFYSTLRNHFYSSVCSACVDISEQCLVETCCCNHHRCYKTCWWWLTFGCFSFIWHTALVLHAPFQKRYNTLHWQKTSGSAPLGSVPVQFSLLSFILSQS